MTRHSRDTERGLRLNPNAQNVFFMRRESIVIWSFLFVAGMSRAQVNKAIWKYEKRGGGEWINWWMDGWITGKIIDSSWLIGGSSVGGGQSGGWLLREEKKETPVSRCPWLYCEK